MAKHRREAIIRKQTSLRSTKAYEVAESSDRTRSGRICHINKGEEEISNTVGVSTYQFPKTRISICSHFYREMC